MKISFKISLAVLTATTCLYLSCKKSETKPGSVKPSLSTEEIGKQISLGLFTSLSGGISQSDNIKPNQTTGKVTTMDYGTPCGSSVKTPTNKTIVSGDTTRKYVGYSIFTYMCDGYFHNNWNVDAYTLLDTSKTTETGTRFANNYTTTLNYVVKAADSHYAYITISGTTSTAWHTSKVKNGVTTEFHDLNTQYKLNEVLAQRTATNPEYKLGRVDFTTQVVDKDATTGANGNAFGYSGYIIFLPDHTARLYFKNADGTYNIYVTNLLTGELTPAKDA